jgi:hypothetical protein
MNDPARPLLDIDDEAAELAAKTAAVAEAEADPRGIPHKIVREWLLELAKGNFEAPPPKPRNS